MAHLDQVTVQGFAHQAALLLVAVDEVAAPAVQRELAGRCAPLPLLQRHPSGSSQELRTRLPCQPTPERRALASEQKAEKGYQQEEDMKQDCATQQGQD